MCGVTVVTIAIRHSQTGLKGSQVLKLVKKTVLSWLQALELIRDDGKLNNAMATILSFVGKQLRESSTASEYV